MLQQHHSYVIYDDDDDQQKKKHSKRKKLSYTRKKFKEEEKSAVVSKNKSRQSQGVQKTQAKAKSSPKYKSKSTHSQTLAFTLRALQTHHTTKPKPHKHTHTLAYALTRDSLREENGRQQKKLYPSKKRKKLQKHTRIQPASLKENKKGSKKAQAASQALATRTDDNVDVSGSNGNVKKSKRKNMYGENEKKNSNE